MGLLGGFKGKLKGKEKKSKKNANPVVCVKFNVHSEFDPSPSVLPSCSYANPGRNDVIKERRRPTKPEIKNVFATNGTVKEVKKETPPTVVPEVKKETPPRVVPEVKKETPPTVVPEVKKEAPPRVEVKKEEPSPVEKQAPIPPKRELFGENKTATPAPQVKNVTPAIVKKAPLPPPRASSSDDDDYGNFNIEFVANKTTVPDAKKEETSSSEDDDGNFKIHIAENVHQQNGDFSEETSEEDEPDSGPFNYSSQATSIFFGEEEEPVMIRPRNIAIDDDDNQSEGSSASA